MQRQLLAITAVMFIACGGCANRPLGLLDTKSVAAPTTKTADVRDVAELQDVVAKLVPPGTSLARAEQIMQAEGFECSFDYDDELGQDFLSCERQDGSSLLLLRRWVVKLAYRDGVVSSAVALRA